MNTTTIELVCVGNDGNGYIKAQCRVGWFEVALNEDERKVQFVDHFIPMREYRRKNRVNYCRYEIPEGVICYYHRAIETKPRKEESRWFRVDDGKFTILGDIVGGTSSFAQVFLHQYVASRYEFSAPQEVYQHHDDPKRVFDESDT
jgi:hypothetical protein